MSREPVVFMDFESRSATNIRAGLAKYFADPECDALMLAYRMPGAEHVSQWHRGPRLDLKTPPPEDLFEFIARGGLVSGFNVMFEYGLWEEVCVRKYGWPRLPLEQCRDTMAIAAAHNLPQSLEKCGEALGLEPEKLKSKRGKYLIQRLSVPHKPTKTRPGKWIEDEDLFAEFLEYNKQDVIAEESIARRLRPLTEYQQRGWLLTQRICKRGVPVDLGECANILSVVDAEKERLNRELRALTDYKVSAATKRDDLLAWVNARVATPVEVEDPVDNDEDRPGHEEAFVDLKGKTVEAALARTDLPPEVRRALEIRAAVVQTSTAKFGKMMMVAAADGTLKNMFVWHGAGTGRWASRGGVNAQNFARPILIQDIKKGLDDIATAHAVLGAGDYETACLFWGDKVMDAAVSCLRGVLKAPAGYDFIDADFSSVENRVGVWLADQEDKVEMFRRGLDEYRQFSSTAIHKVPYDAVTKDMRQMAKSAVLGCLFGQGWRGLIAYAEGYGVHLTDDRSQAVVKAYREEYRKVRDLWYDCGDASIAAVKNPGVWFAAGTKLSLICHRNFLWLKLPSGRLLAWSRPRVEEREAPWLEKHFVGFDDEGDAVFEHRPAMREVVTVESIETKTRLYVRHPLIGSSIFQSAVQGSAADVLFEGVEHTEAAGYETVLLAHDENMALVPEGWGDPDEFGRLMCTPAEWRADLPLAYEAYRSKRFRK